MRRRPLIRQLRPNVARWLAKRRGIGGWLTTVTVAGQLSEYLGLRGGVSYIVREVIRFALAALACVELSSRFTRNRVSLLNVPPPNSGKNAFDYCGHTGAAVSGCGVDVAGVTAPHPLCDAF